MNQPFHFKQFSIQQDRCAMKIGTDGVLLGAWTSVNDTIDSILDIGTGTGLIALMMAQRSNAKTIDAIEIDENAFEQCVGNFEASPWNDRLFCYHSQLNEFVEEIEDRYDLILSNPPFHSENNSSGSISRDIARHNSSLPFEDLLSGISVLLSEDGIFSTIIPFRNEDNFISQAALNHLFPRLITRVRGNTSGNVKRSLIELGFHEKETLYDELTIEIERHHYTEEYIALTKDFYLKM